MSSSPERVRIALVGFGKLAQQVYTPLLRKRRDVEVVSVVDPLDERRAVARAAFPRAETFASHVEMLARVDCEAVLISTSTGTHATLALEALQKGKHVYLEKPAAANLADAKRLVAARRGSGMVGMMGFNYRFSRAIQSARALLQAGRIGQARMIRSVFSTSIGSPSRWRTSRREGGGVLLDLGSHHVDLFSYLCGAGICEVHAHVTTVRTEDDSAVLQMTMRNGMAAQSYFSLGGVEEDIIEIYGDAGKLTIDRYGLESVRFSAVSHGKARWQRMTSPWQGVLPSARLWRKLRAPWHEPSYGLALTRFVAAVCDPLLRDYPNFEDGLRCQIILDAAERSSCEEKSIECEEVTGE